MKGKIFFFLIFIFVIIGLSNCTIYIYAQNIINGETRIWENTIIELNNITIKNNGNLTIIESIINAPDSYLFVRDSSSLSIKNSTINTDIKIFGDDITLRFIDKNNHSEEGTDYYLYVRDSKRDLKYFESGFIEKGKEIIWQMFDNSENRKYKDSDGRKRIVVDVLGKTELIYDTDLDNWEEAPISIKKDKFFTESEDKFHKYHTKLSNFVKPPYFKNLNYLGVDFKDWKPVLSMIFDRDIKLDGVTQDRNDIIDSLTGEIIYSESDFGPDKGQTFANYITGEYGDTLD